MADSSALAGLLDRASHVFSLAGKLGSAFQEQRLSGGGHSGYSDAAARWNQHAATFDEFCNDLLKLRDAMQNPPDGFTKVAERLLDAAKIDKGIRDATQRPEGMALAAYVDTFPDLNSVSHEGWKAVEEITKARRLDDPFAFVDEPAANNPTGIDTTPTLALPPAELIEAAGRDIPGILANVKPRGNSPTEMVASHLARRLQDAGHTLAAAHWAIHEALRVGRLRADRIETSLPAAISQGPLRLPGCSDERRMVRTGGGRAFEPIPKGKPAPYDAFRVIATDALWEWWRSLTAKRPSESEPGATSIKAGEAFRRKLEREPETREGWERTQARLQAFGKAMQEAMDSPEYRAAQEVERQRWQELADAIRANVERAGDELAGRHFTRPESIEDWEHLARIVGIPAETIRTGNLTAREIFACALAWADRQTIKAKLAAETNAGTTKPTASADAEPVDDDSEDNRYDVPQVDEYDDRVVWWIGKRIYLGRDTQIARLFWLLAKPVGRAHSLGEVQQVIDGMETSIDTGSTPEEIEKAGKRLRKVIAKLKAAMREGKLDTHFVIHRGGSQDEPEYSLIPRFGANQ